MSRTPAQPQFARLALLPGLLGAIILLAALALIGNDWYLWAQYGAAILALIMCVFAAQGRQFWWFAALIPIAVIWNPVWPIGLPDLALRLLHILGAAAFVAAGIGIRVPSSEPQRR
jgi:hypothetical protein